MLFPTQEDTVSGARARTTTHGGVNDNDDDDATLWSLPYVCLTRVMTENVNENRLARRTGICRANAFRGGRCRLLRCARDVILCTYRVLLLLLIVRSITLLYELVYLTGSARGARPLPRYIRTVRVLCAPTALQEFRTVDFWKELRCVAATRNTRSQKLLDVDDGCGY